VDSAPDGNSAHAHGGARTTAAGRLCTGRISVDHASVKRQFRCYAAAPQTIEEACDALNRIANPDCCLGGGCRGICSIGVAGTRHYFAPLITGASIMPLSTPHIVAMVRYSPVRIRCSSASRNDSASGEPLATGQP
jgi:hypothetical protein